MEGIAYHVIKNGVIVGDYDTRNEAIKAAKKDEADLVVKFDLVNFEPLAIVWERSSEELYATMRVNQAANGCSPDSTVKP
jgi:hypothetical protein